MKAYNNKETVNIVKRVLENVNQVIHEVSADRVRPQYLQLVSDYGDLSDKMPDYVPIQFNESDDIKPQDFAGNKINRFTQECLKKFTVVKIKCDRFMDKSKLTTRNRGLSIKLDLAIVVASVGIVISAFIMMVQIALVPWVELKTSQSSNRNNTELVTTNNSTNSVVIQDSVDTDSSIICHPTSNGKR